MAKDEPEIEAKIPDDPMPAIPKLPLTPPKIVRVASNNFPAIPEWVAKTPIKINKGIALKSYLANTSTGISLSICNAPLGAVTAPKPTNPTPNMASATGTRRTTSRIMTIKPMAPIISGLMRLSPRRQRTRPF